VAAIPGTRYPARVRCHTWRLGGGRGAAALGDDAPLPCPRRWRRGLRTDGKRQSEIASCGVASERTRGGPLVGRVAVVIPPTSWAAARGS